MKTTNLSKASLWTGRVLSGLVILFMLFDSILKLLKPEVVVQSTVGEFGFKESHIVPFGILALIATLLYALPKTAVPGAILLTAYFGGAIASQVRIGNPLFSHTLFPVYLGILTWA